MLTALVTSTGSVATDITLKSLKRMGFRVIGCNIYPREWVVESCEMDGFYQAPLVSDSDNYLKFIQKVCMEENVNYVLPMIDHEIDILNLHRKWFVEHDVVLCISPKESIEVIRNKKRLADFIESNCPLTTPIPTMMLRDIKKLEWDFPFVCKPYNGRSSQGLRYIHNIDEWHEFSSTADKDTYIVEPYIEGPIVMVELVRQSNPHKVIATTRKELLSTPHGCSTAVLIYKDEKLEWASKILADKLGVLGDVNFEYILGNDGKYYFVECNPRFSAGCEFSCIAGYDYVENHMKCFMGREIEDAHFKHNMIISRKYEEYITATEVIV